MHSRDIDARSFLSRCAIPTAPSVNTIATTDANGNHHHHSHHQLHSSNQSAVLNNNHNDLNIPHYHKKRGRPHDILKEILMLERTFSKELELISTWVNEFLDSDLSTVTVDPFHRYLSILQPLANIHRSYLAETEERVSRWCQEMDTEEAVLPFSNFKSLTDTMLSCLQFYQSLTESLPTVYYYLNASLRSRVDFEKSFREFESSQSCFLPLTSVLVKPIFHPRTLFPLFSREYSLSLVYLARMVSEFIDFLVTFLLIVFVMLSQVLLTLS